MKKSRITCAIAGHETDPGATLAHDLQRDHRVARVALCDLFSRRSAEAALARACPESAGIDVLIHAHVPKSAFDPIRVADMSDVSWDEQCEAVLRSTIHFLQAAHGQLKEDGGVVIIIAPTLGLAGQAGRAAYAAACEAQRCLVKASARAWGRKGIRCHSVAIAPELAGATHPDFDPGRPPLVQASLSHRSIAALRADLAQTVRFLMGAGAAGLTGTTTAVDGGRWMPL